MHSTLISTFLLLLLTTLAIASPYYTKPTKTKPTKPYYTKPPKPTKTWKTTKPCTATGKTTCDISICADYLTTCGTDTVFYGDCFLDPICTGGTVWPTILPPPCTVTPAS